MASSNPFANDKFEKEIDSITQSNKPIGIEEFLLDRAMKEKQTAITKNLLRETNLSTAEVARLVGVSVEFVEGIKKTTTKKGR